MPRRRKLKSEVDLFLDAGMTPASKKQLKNGLYHKAIIDIVCSVCGIKRKIFKQDTHQVKRCRDCQRKMRNARIRPKKERIDGGAVAKRGKRRKKRQSEPIIPDFNDGPESESNPPSLVL